MRAGSPSTMRERQCIAAALREAGMSWTELTHRLKGRGELARHLLAGRQAPRPLSLAALPDAVVYDYLRRLRRRR